MSGKKVLHLDKNNYYGGEAASLNLDQLYEKFGEGKTANPALGKSQAYCVDLCPKFVMACDDLVNILLAAGVTDYLEFRSVAGSYVYSGGVKKVPASVQESLTCGLLGLMEMNGYRKFLQFNYAYDEGEAKTHLTPKKNDINKITAAQLLADFGLKGNTIMFTGHAIALHPNEDYLEQGALDLVKRSQLYAHSVARYGQSPYIYPRYGLGGLPEGFSRRCAVYGGVFMLNMSNADPFIENINYGGDGKVTGIKLGQQVCDTYEIKNPDVTCSQIVADPSYFIGTDKVALKSQIARCICIMDKPIPSTNADSCQLIMPGSAIGRKNDIYVCMVSWNHNVAEDGKYIAVMSTTVESDGGPEANLKPALGLLDGVLEKFSWVSDYYEPTGDGSKDSVYITSSMDATTHFQSSMAEVLGLFETITGSPFTPPPKKTEE
jgi:Rab GDP dissociation inhibitor